MRLTRYEPWEVLGQFRKDLEQLFGNRTGTQFDEDSAIATSAWIPAIDIKEENNQFLIEADIPGVDPKDIEVSMEGGVLTIKGERATVSKEEAKNYKRVERVYGNFYRRFSLPDTADPEKITATGKNGVLKISIPKREVVQPRKINVQV